VDQQRAQPAEAIRAGSQSEPVEPVLVIGAGPVGQTAALLLARWGLPVIVVDARPERDLVGSKALVQQRDVIDVWCAVGAGDEIAAQGVTWTTGRTMYRDRELFATQWVDRGASPLPAFVNISQSRTEARLDEQIARQPLIDVRWDHEVVGLTQDDHGVTITCRSGKSESNGKDEVRLHGSHAIACGGARGDGLRGLLGVTFDGESFTDPFLICDLRTDLGSWSHERRFYFDPEWNPGRQVLVHPCPDSTYRIDWQVPPGYDLAAEEASGALDRRIRQIVGDREYEIVWKSVYRFHARCADRFRVGRVLLAGDLAHLVSPFGARGLNSGVQDAENAAWKIAFARNGWGDEDVLLTSYDVERLAAARENIAVSTATMDFLAPRDAEAWQHRREVLERAVDDSSVHPQVDSGRLAEPYWYGDSPLVTPDPTRAAPARPPKGQYPEPAPGVLVPDFPVAIPDRPQVTRLRQLVRDGLLVLVAGTAGAQRARAALGPVAAPVAVLDVDAIAENGRARSCLGLEEGEYWLVRPDGHIAAVARDTTALLAAAHVAVGRASTPAFARTG
jgi:3-(3-hydroxy-phenyl)propionate hydroxylase